MAQNQCYRSCWCRVDTSPFKYEEGDDFNPEADLRRWANCQHPDIVKTGKYELSLVFLQGRGGNVAVLSDLMENPNPENCKTCPHYKFDADVERRNKIGQLT